jgi:hypothetical protein
MRVGKKFRLVAALAMSTILLAGCGAPPPDSFVEQVDDVEFSFVDRFIATKWFEVFWNEDGTIDEMNFLDQPIQDSDLAELAIHHRLRILKLGSTDITGVGLSHLVNSKELVMLGLRGTKVDDEGLSHLGQLKHLRSLLLAGTAVTDAGLVHLEGLDQLQELGLSDTAITDEGLRVLRRLPSLALLHVSDCAITREGAEELRAALPDIQIFPIDGEYAPLERNLRIDDEG